MILNAPSWVTPKGFLFTGTELILNSYTVTATNTSSYTLINGSLPPGMTLSTSSGLISGIPDPVLNLNSYKFTIRASNTNASSDRTFFIDIQGSDLPIWNTVTIIADSGSLVTSTTEGYLPIGLQEQPYALNNQYIDFQFTATVTQAPTTAKIQYFIPDQGGSLPPNLELNSNGRLVGILNCFTSTDITTVTNTTTIYNPKEYQFYITATDSVRQASRLFKLIAVDPNMLKYWTPTSNTDIEVLNLSLQTQYYNYLQPPQFINSSDLGTIRADNFHIINASAYNPDPLIGTLTYSVITGTTVSTNIPYGLELDKNTGYISGYISYQPAYTRSYQFIINAEKTDGFETVSTTNTFSLQVKGVVESTIKWVSTQTIGSIFEGQISELYIKAEQIQSNYSIKYTKTSGILPEGLTLQSDGTITGKVAYNTSGTYTFTANAKDVYELSAIEKTFSLEVKPQSKEYTQIYIKPFLPKIIKNNYINFLENKDVFNPKSIYRYFDTNFGIQKELKIILEFGIEKINIADFYPTLNSNFYRRKFYFGDIKIAYAKDSFGNTVYELIYSEAIDELFVNNKSVSLDITINSSTYYPASIDNMRYRLKNIVINNTATVSTDQKYNPIFFNDITSFDQNVVSYIKYIPVCYANPGEGNKILNRIKFSKFDFKQLFIETDRLIIQETLADNSEKYVFFPKRNIKF